MQPKSRSTKATIVADFGDNLSPKTATVAENGDCRRLRRQLPFSVTGTVAEFGDSRRFLRQSPKSATVAVFGDGVDRA